MDGIADRLRAERDATLARLSELTRSFDDVVASIDGVGNDDEHDPEGATIGFERAQLRALLDAAQAQLREIDAAVGRIAEGTFGRCERCGQAIAPERLEARPTSLTCVRCASADGRRVRSPGPS